MNILLTAVNAKYIHSNLAVYSLRAYAEKYKKEVSIAEYTINQQTDEILADIYRRHPDILCFSCYLWNITCVKEIITEIAKILPDTEIWLGGPEVSYNPLELMEKYKMLSGIMCGEGEQTFLELMEYYHHAEEQEEIIPDAKRRDEELSRIRGIAYRKSDGTVGRTAPRPALDLSTVPFAYKNINDFRNRIVYYESSRGCPFSCSYCLSSVDKCLRFRDLELVKKELQFFIDNEVPQVKFVDRTFNCRRGHAMEVWKYIKEHDRGITNFHFEIAADLLDEEEIRLIRGMRPGLVQLEIGIQSANSRTISEIKRKMDLEKVERAVAAVREKRNIHQHLDLIAGLPWEDYRSFAASFNRVCGMRPDQLQLGFLKVLKGSLMYEKAEEYALAYQDRPPYEVLFTKWLSYEEIIRLKQIEEMVEVYYNSGQFQNTMKRMEREFADPFSMYEALAAYYERNGFFQISHSRTARYEILFNFIRESVGTDENRPEIMAEYTEWLTLDLYLRDNVRNRPEFLGKIRVSPDEAAAFYKEEESSRRYLKDYTGYDRRQMRKMTHLERIRGGLLLFDYRNRDPLTGNAAVYCVDGRKTADEMTEGKEEQ